MKVLIKENKQGQQQFLNMVKSAEPVLQKLVEQLQNMDVELSYDELKAFLQVSYAPPHVGLSESYTDRVGNFLKGKIKEQNKVLKDLPIKESAIRLPGLDEFASFLMDNRKNDLSLYNAWRFFNLEKGVVSQNKGAIEKHLDTFNSYAETEKEVQLTELIHGICHTLNSYIEKTEKLGYSKAIKLNGFTFNNGVLEADPQFIKGYAERL